MAEQFAILGNLVIAMAYVAITVAIVVPLRRANQLASNRLASATALIFFSCAIGHAFHASAYLQAIVAGNAEIGHHMTQDLWQWPAAIWDLFTAATGVYYWTLRRGYKVLLGPGALYVDPHELKRLHDIELRERVAAGRAEAEAERDVHAAMLSAVIANSQSAIYVKDLDGRYLLANEAFQRAFGVAEDEVLGKTDEYIDPVLAPVWRAHDLRARVDAFEVEEHSDAPEGRHTYESVKFPLYDATGGLYATCSISLDVTGLRRAMADAEQARDEALAQSQIKSDFLAIMSHEIRTPMNGVLGLASLLLGTSLDPAQRRYAAGIHTAGNALLGVINDILDFSKIEADRLDLDPGDFDIAAMLDDVTALIGPAAADKELLLVTRCAASVPALVRGDGGRLRQILLNLAGNAVKFTAGGSVTLRAESLPATPSQAGPTVRFEVADTGIGIAPDTAERLFEPFTQADASTTRMYGGTGLGLAISRRLTEAMGGRIGVDSAIGTGSTFWCEIPFEAARGPVADAPGAIPDVSSLRILVVGDRDAQQSLRTDLGRWRMSASGVDDVAGVLDALREAADRGRPYDVLIIDIGSGVDAAALARTVDADAGVPSVHVIGFGTDTTSPTQPAGTGELTYLPKPVHHSQLFDQLARSMTTDLPDAPQPRTVANGVVEPDVAPQSIEAAPVEAVPVEADLVEAAPADVDPGEAVVPRILLVEDNEINQLVAVGILKRLGYGCDIADDGMQALDLTDRTSYDVILMDCRMPRMDGFAATAELRRREGTDRHTTIIAMTASALAADRDRCLAAGMDDYLPKPVTLAELGATLQRWLARIGTPSTPSPVVPPSPPLSSAAPLDPVPVRDLAAAEPMPAEVATPPAAEVVLLPVGDDPVLRRLDELAGGRTTEELSSVSTLILSFLDRVPRHFAALADAVAAADGDLVEDRAHTLAGAAGNLGATAAADICRRLETRGRDGDLTGATADLHTLRAEIDRVDRRLHAILTGADPEPEPVAPSDPVAPAGQRAPSDPVAPSGPTALSGPIAPSGPTALSGSTAPSGPARQAPGQPGPG